jgi:hypothetical protein
MEVDFDGCMCDGCGQQVPKGALVAACRECEEYDLCERCRPPLSPARPARTTRAAAVAGSSLELSPARRELRERPSPHPSDERARQEIRGPITRQRRSGPLM